MSKILVLLVLFSCQGRADNISEGKALYTRHCISCHNVNPSKPGSIGPELVTTPSIVFDYKVPFGKYPPGYMPKKGTNAMPKFKHLADDTRKIYDYIQTFKR